MKEPTRAKKKGQKPGSKQRKRKKESKVGSNKRKSKMKKRSTEKMWDGKLFEVDPTNKSRLVKIPVEHLGTSGI